MKSELLKRISIFMDTRNPNLKNKINNYTIINVLKSD